MDARRTLVTLVAMAALLFGCGDDDAADESADAEESSRTAPVDAADTLPASCPNALPYDVEVRLDGDGPRETMTVVDSIALRRLDGRAWTVYLADFDLPDDTSWGLVAPTVPPGKTLLATGLDVFNATDAASLPILDVGASGGLFRDVGEGETATFVNVTADRAGSTSVDQRGTSELLHLGARQVCLSVDITSESGIELVGVYTAFELVDI